MAKGRVVLITGGGSGIGRACALKFAEHGDMVYILGRDTQKLDAVAAEHSNISTIAADVTAPDEVGAAKDAVTKNHQTIDVLVNCAGGTAPVAANPDLAEARRAWDAIVDLNLTGVFNVTFTFESLLRRPGGRIINITSIAALAGSSRPTVSGTAYASAKAGVHGLSRHYANALAPEGITVNCVAPGVIDHTEFFGSGGMADDRKQINSQRTPAGRLGEPNEIAAGVFYLASDESGFITGEILNINGGLVFGR